jgi:hypothetical protein
METQRGRQHLEDVRGSNSWSPTEDAETAAALLVEVADEEAVVEEGKILKSGADAWSERQRDGADVETVMPRSHAAFLAPCRVPPPGVDRWGRRHPEENSWVGRGYHFFLGSQTAHGLSSCVGFQPRKNGGFPAGIGVPKGTLKWNNTGLQAPTLANPGYANTSTIFIKRNKQR